MKDYTLKVYIAKDIRYSEINELIREFSKRIGKINSLKHMEHRNAKIKRRNKELETNSGRLLYIRKALFDIKHVKEYDVLDLGDLSHKEMKELERRKRRLFEKIDNLLKEFDCY